MKIKRLNELSDNKISLDSINDIKNEYLQILANITKFLRIENKIDKVEFVTHISILDDIIEIIVEDNISEQEDILTLDEETTQNIIRYLNNSDEYLASKKYNL